MIIRPILIAFISFFTLILSAQEIEWAKCYGGSDLEESPFIEKTTDGGYIVAGTTSSSDGDVSEEHQGFGDYWVVKLDSIGNLEWEESYGGASVEFLRAIQKTSNGGYIITGLSGSDNGDVTGNHGGYDYWVVKLDAVGILEWQKSLGGIGDEESFYIQQTTDDGFIVSGETRSNDGDVSGNHGSYDGWVVKLDASGNLVWQNALGGSGWDSFITIQQTEDGGYIAVGGSDSNDGDVSGNHGFSDVWVVKLDTIGNLEWQKSYGGSGYDLGWYTEQTNDGGYIVGGTTQSNDGDVTGFHGTSDYWILKLNQDGILEWQKTLGGTEYEFCQSAQQTSDGGYILVGAAESDDGDVTGNHGDWDYWIVKLDNAGNLIRQKSFGGAGYESGSFIQQTNDGGSIACGETNFNDGDVSGSHGGTDFWVVKLAPVITSVENTVLEIQIQVYPNPASEILILESEKLLTNPLISISTLDGKLVYEHRYASSNQIKINVASLPAGVYLLEMRSVVDGQEGKTAKKILIE